MQKLKSLYLTVLATLSLAATSSAIELSDPRIHEVRAYVYDYTQEKESDITIDGRLHKGIINKKGAKLDKKQSERLITAISKQPHPGGIPKLAKCYWPHHGFVFYDKEGKILGHAEVCLQCGRHRDFNLAKLSQYWDLKEIKTLLEELKLPILKGDRAYTQLYEESLLKLQS